MPAWPAGSLAPCESWPDEIKLGAEAAIQAAAKAVDPAVG